LTSRQDRRFAKIDQNNNGLIDKDGFKARLVGMFTRMDQNGENLLRDDELPRQGYGKDIIISTIIVTKTLKASTDAN
jgi:hypothetical protein